MTFAFIRHGQTDWNRENLLQGSSDIPLNDTGRAQALEAVELLRGTAWAAIVSSPLVRARETAEIIADRLGVPLGPSYRELAERDYGPLEGTSSHAAIERHPSREYPGAESLASVAARGTAGLAKIAEDYPDADVVIVSHGTLIRYTLASLARHPIEDIRNGSVSTFHLEGDRWTVLTVNGAPLVAVAVAVADPDTGTGTVLQDPCRSSSQPEGSGHDDRGIPRVARADPAQPTAARRAGR